MDFCRRTWNIGKEDPRKLMHAIKVGGALSVVCPLYLTDHIFEEFAGNNAIWAVITVVVVFEFTAGATLYKGLNRALGTLVAGILGLLLGYLAKCSTGTPHAIIIGIALFIFGAVVTYLRFMPSIKAKFDYGMVIFLLTFAMILMSSYRAESVLTVAYHRLFTVLIGIGICFLISWMIYPIWAGEDLHRRLFTNLRTLSTSFKECIDMYFEERDSCKFEESDDDPIYQSYKSILDSKANEESLVTYARWEPRHGRFRCRHPWKHYQKVLASIRHCALGIVALHGCLTSQIQTSQSTRSHFKKQCKDLSDVAVALLDELADSVDKMRRPSSSEPILKQLNQSINTLQNCFRSDPTLLVDSTNYNVREISSGKKEKDAGLHNEEETSGSNKKSEIKYSCVVNVQQEKSNLEEETKRKPVNIHVHDKNIYQHNYGDVLPLATFASLMVEFGWRLKSLAMEVDELARLAQFKAGRKTPYEGHNNHCFPCIKGNKKTCGKVVAQDIEGGMHAAD